MLTVEQFLGNLWRSGLMSREEAQALWESLELEAPPGDGAALARELVWQGLLTPFQASVLCEESPRRLRLGDYLLLSKLGSGGMGQVFQVRHRRLGAIRALKVLPKRLLKSGEAVRRFRREIETSAMLNHPNIVAALDAGVEKGIYFLVMEFVPGRTLSHLVKERGPLSWTEAWDYTLQAARGLDYAHRQNVTHRDVKPSNLLLNWKGVVKVLDLGLARIVSLSGQDNRRAEPTALTLAGNLLGTVDFMAPEQVIDTHRADARSDIYSLGCTLYFLLTGEPPFPGKSVAQKVAARFKQPTPSLFACRPEVPEAAQVVFKGMLRKHPENRFQTMAEVVAALEALPKPNS